MKNNLNNIWHIDMQLDLTESEIKEELTPIVEFTKIGLIDWLLLDDLTQDFFKNCINYQTSDNDLKSLLNEFCSDWKVLKIEEK